MTETLETDLQELQALHALDDSLIESLLTSKPQGLSAYRVLDTDDVDGQWNSDRNFGLDGRLFNPPAPAPWAYLDQGSPNHNPVWITAGDKRFAAPKARSKSGKIHSDKA